MFLWLTLNVIRPIKISNYNRLGHHEPKEAVLALYQVEFAVLKVQVLVDIAANINNVLVETQRNNIGRRVDVDPSGSAFLILLSHLRRRVSKAERSVSRLSVQIRQEKILSISKTYVYAP